MTIYPIRGQLKFPAERAADMKLLTKVDSTALDFLVRSDLVQHNITRLDINSMALLNKKVSLALDVMRNFRNQLDRKLERQDHDWMEIMRRLTITEKTDTRPIAIRSRDVEWDCQPIVNQLVNSIPMDVLLRTSNVEHQELTSTEPTQGVSVTLKSRVARRFQFVDAKEESKPCSDCSSGKETLSGESGSIMPEQDNLSGEPMPERHRAEFCPGSQKTWRISLKETVQTPSDRLTVLSLKTEGTCLKRLPFRTHQK